MKPYSTDLRKKIIDVYEEEKISQRQLAKRFRVAKSFVQKLFKQYRETGSIEPKKRSQQTPTKLNDEQLNFLQSLVEEKNDATLEELSEDLADATGILISRSTVHRMLKRLNLTFKKKALHASEKRTEKVLNERLNFWNKIKDIITKNLVFLDETGVNLSLSRLFARSIKGQRAYGQR